MHYVKFFTQREPAHKLTPGLLAQTSQTLPTPLEDRVTDLTGLGNVERSWQCA